MRPWCPFAVTVRHRGTAEQVGTRTHAGMAGWTLPNNRHTTTTRLLSQQDVSRGRPRTSGIPARVSWGRGWQWPIQRVASRTAVCSPPACAADVPSCESHAGALADTPRAGCGRCGPGRLCPRPDLLRPLSWEGRPRLAAGDLRHTCYPTFRMPPRLFEAFRRGGSIASPEEATGPPSSRRQMVAPLGLVAGRGDDLGRGAVRDPVTHRPPETRLVPAGHVVTAMVPHGVGVGVGVPPLPPPPLGHDDAGEPPYS
jgi:hypothetical protein